MNMKWICFLALLLSACGGGPDRADTVSVEIVGNIYNGTGKAESIPLGSSHITDRLGDVKQREDIMSSATITNDGAVDIDNLYVVLWIEGISSGEISVGPVQLAVGKTFRTGEHTSGGSGLNVRDDYVVRWTVYKNFKGDEGYLGEVVEIKEYLFNVVP